MTVESETPAGPFGAIAGQKTIDDVYRAAEELLRWKMDQGYTIEAIHPYTDETGVPLHWVLRLRHQTTGEKWLRPMMVGDDGQFVVSRPPYEQGVPLYNLLHLKAAPEATVWIVEGEACADALMGFFGECGVYHELVAVTTGAASSVNRADLIPLTGRRIVIWPDHDDTGAKYANDLAARLLTIAKEIFVLDVAEIAANAGEDCVDWLAQHEDAIPADLRALPRRALPVYTPPGPEPLDGDDEFAEGEIVLIRASDVPMRPIRWLWRGVLALGKTTLVASNPGLGKSVLSAELAAIVTRGKCFPLQQEPTAPGNVVIASAEDARSDTIRPRLHVAGADMGRIVFADVVVRAPAPKGRRHRVISLAEDMGAIIQAMERVGGVRLLVIDPISSYLDGVDSNSNSEVRSILYELTLLAERFDCAVLVITHLNKAMGADAMARVLGSLAFVAGPRIVFGVVEDQLDAERRLLLPLKNNIARDNSGYAYRLEQVFIEKDMEPARIVWEDQPVMQKMGAALAAAAAAANGGGASSAEDSVSETNEAKAFLREMLAKGPVASKEVLEAAEANGFKEGSLRRAQRLLGIVATKIDKTWAMSMPSKRPKDDAAQRDEP